MPKSSSSDTGNGDEGKQMPKSFNGSSIGCEGTDRDSPGTGSGDKGNQMPKSSDCTVDGACMQNLFTGPVEYNVCLQD